MSKLVRRQDVMMHVLILEALKRLSRVTWTEISQVIFFSKHGPEIIFVIVLNSIHIISLFTYFAFVVPPTTSPPTNYPPEKSIPAPHITLPPAATLLLGFRPGPRFCDLDNTMPRVNLQHNCSTNL